MWIPDMKPKQTTWASFLFDIILRDRSYTNSKDSRNYKQNDFIVCRKKAKPQQGGSETEGLPPDAARGWVGGDIKIQRRFS